MFLMKFSRSQTQRAMLRKNAHRLVCILALSAFSEASFSASAPWVGETLNKTVCQGKGQGYGPFDYTSPTDRKHLGIVEHYHFTSDVEHLRKGASGSIALDLDYTLRAFPNHHRALNAMMTFQLQKHIYNQRHSDIPLLSAIFSALLTSLQTMSMYTYFTEYTSINVDSKSTPWLNTKRP